MNDGKQRVSRIPSLVNETPTPDVEHDRVSCQVRGGLIVDGRAKIELAN
jgi:hypothetical protein